MNFKFLKDSKAKNFITGILSSHGSTLAMGCGFAGFGFWILLLIVVLLLILLFVDD